MTTGTVTVPIARTDDLHAALNTVDRSSVVWWPGTLGPQRGWEYENPRRKQLAQWQKHALNELSRAGLIEVGPHLWLGYRSRPVTVTAAGKVALRTWSHQRWIAA